jgi:hypothetical protein
VDEDQLTDVAGIIDNMWSSAIGDEIVKARRKRDSKASTPEKQVRDAVEKILAEIQVRGDGVYEDIPEDFKFHDCTLGELFEMLQGLDDWKEIESRLASMEIEEPEEVEAEITF